MPLIDNYLLDNYLIDGPNMNSNTRTVIGANRTLYPGVAESTTSLYMVAEFDIPLINKFSDIYSPSPATNINVPGNYLYFVHFKAASTMFFSTSEYIEVSFMLRDEQNVNFVFLSSKVYGGNYSDVTPDTTTRLYSLYVDKENRKLHCSGTRSSGGGDVVLAIDIPSNFNLNGKLSFRVGAQKNYAKGGLHTLTIERRALNVLTS
ncbi:hypothetical protein MKY66_06400 [Paenibacillus sp. FSL R5-0766]|uniref:hypothetical protein n=1 Tax=unclassified Paenibacillus TaxID=185978 RepID=UPI00096C508F|nr:hypothetical protein [Paenibacillus sp. FSL R5-0765]OMF66312.1 hypothetical protein BK141_05135 [Paenibacillus sp. FSL R5-0765]